MIQNVGTSRRINEAREDKKARESAKEGSINEASSEMWAKHSLTVVTHSP
jgi:hypothetical protein